jgi:hypothetical protein
MKITDKISNGIHTFEVENVGRNDGCAFCGNERCDLFFISGGNDIIGGFDEVCGDNFICGKCLPKVVVKHNYKFI